MIYRLKCKNRETCGDGSVLNLKWPKRPVIPKVLTQKRFQKSVVSDPLNEKPPLQAPKRLSCGSLSQLKLSSKETPPSHNLWTFKYLPYLLTFLFCPHLSGNLPN
ncbi:MAG: hypothetical protein LBF22_02805 [Deltaproteobacteria bacterium]|nr:hypothetical protein [Deltaproteobacteria bacterium]